MWEGLNKRRFPRVQYACDITLTRKNITDTISTRTENIGRGGICVTLPCELELFEPVSLRITLQPNTPPIGCQGTVVWVVRQTGPNVHIPPSYDIGIEFTPSNEHDLSDIEQVIRQSLKED